MVEQAPSRAVYQDAEDGYMLLAVVVMVALMLIAVSVAVPIIAKDIRRQKEMESERRSLDFERAIRLYYRKNKGYPPNMDALLKGTDIHYLRRKWIDPLTGKDDWRIIHTPKTKTHFPFGEELAGGMGAGLGSAAGMASGATGVPTGGTTGTSLTTGCNATNSAFCQQPATTSTSGGSNGGIGSTTGSSSSSNGGGMFGDSGGGPIYGVATSKTGDSILTPNQQTTYETWEFWYDPLIELFYQKANPAGGGGMGSQSASSFGQNGVTGQPNSGGTTSNNPFGPTSGSTPGTNPSPSTGSSSPF